MVFPEPKLNEVPPLPKAGVEPNWLATGAAVDPNAGVEVDPESPLPTDCAGAEPNEEAPVLAPKENVLFVLLLFSFVFAAPKLKVLPAFELKLKAI